MSRSLLQLPRLIVLLLAAHFLVGSPVHAGTPSQGQTLYVPVYSHVFSGDRGLPFNLAATLSLRNCDPEKPLRILAADYYDSKGKRLKQYFAEPLEIAPLASHSIFIKETDTEGGFGASFIVRWQSTSPVQPPVVEAVMIGARSGQGISFISPARVIADAPSR